MFLWRKITFAISEEAYTSSKHSDPNRGLTEHIMPVMRNPGLYMPLTELPCATSPFLHPTLHANTCNSQNAFIAEEIRLDLQENLRE